MPSSLFTYVPVYSFHTAKVLELPHRLFILLLLSNRPFLQRFSSTCLALCKQRGKKRFFTRFPLISCRFRSIPLAFRHSLKALFPCAPHCTVAEDVVKTLPGPCRLKTQAKTRKRFCLDCPHCNFAGKMKHSFLCRTRLRNWGAVNKKGDLK